MEDWFKITDNRVSALEDRFATIDHLIRSSNTAESLFAQKVHDLKSIDQKRDDVIDALCQQIAALIQRIDKLESDHGTTSG